MASRVYTAQEMREMATACQDNADCILADVEAEGGCTYQPLCKNDVAEYSTISDMLRQAADMRSRVDELSLTFHSCPDQRDMLNYILRGVAEGKSEAK